MDFNQLVAMSPNKSMLETATEQYPMYVPGYDPSTMGLAGSGWEGLLRKQLAMKKADALEKGVNKSASSAAQARSDLAMQGGLTSGARERIAEGAQKNYMDMTQGLAKDANQGEFAIADVENSLREKDVANLMGEKARKNDHEMRAYEAKMKALAAEKQAQATEDSGKK